MNFRRQAKRIFSAALAVWISGIVVLFCCQMPSEAANQEIESCPLAKKGNCTKTAENDSETSFGQESFTFDCCAFPAKIFDKARKIENTSQTLISTDGFQAAAPKFFIAKKTFASARIHRSFVCNRAGTYLRNRVFRI